MCHDASGWTPADFPDHEPLFPIDSGAHRDYDCGDCHTDSTDLGVFTCTTEACHPRGETDEHHHEVGGYAYQSAACYDCHPRGDAE
jgi:DnaJ-class molecular chaperone